MSLTVPPSPFIAPSILSADFGHLGDDVRQAVELGAPWIHCDIMDGHFVPNLTFGPDTVRAVRSAAPQATVDVHLMVERPDWMLEPFREAGADILSVHVEACPHLHRTIQQIHDLGAAAGVALNPATPWQRIEPVLSMVDVVVIMSVNPGFGGQSFIMETLDKARALRDWRSKHEASFVIQFDGGVSPETIDACLDAGGQSLVAGSSFFKAPDRKERWALFQSKINQAYD
ncbi:MAG TPA: ribulose-phosphate 3-epimerase [Bacteroidetes bacterium]|nr:MAG: ribulose-phosphate 3-epimerase [Rhodothermaeota bacterium MED-G64]RPF80135.1 MAG: ribulose-phosphate 3-epimerase [Rhodothermaceae bacterium TMED105]HBD42321.1 ribulose-phosphate 3-epimerase [Bacteroidota bacterium]HBW00459.1 ribulose-phosphate 3-epimerase [Bacteroidota bacterium]|tara:strand:- start:4056 stop:4745 length:690 start_codon:yes stop_codon:yes gene_type:complete